MLRRFYCPEYFISKTNHIKLDNNPSWKNDYINKIIVLYDDNQEAIVNVLDIQKTQSYVFLRIKEISFDLDSVDNFVFDLDGTLLNKKSMLSNEQLQSLNTLKSLNKKIIISTGRPWFTAKNMIKDIPTNLPISFANGSIIKHNNEVIKYFNIHQETGINLYKKLVEWEYDFLVYTPDKIYGYNTNKTDFFINKKYPERIGNENYAEGNFSLEINNWTFCKFLVIRRSNDETKWNELLKYIKKQSQLYGVISEEPYLDVMGINASKGNSLTWLSKEYNLDLNKTICFGDAENDETMFNVAKFSGLTSNCFESVKNKAIFNLGDNDTNWLNDFIKKYNKKDQI